MPAAQRRSPEEKLRELDRLPDSAKVDVQVVALHENVSPSTIWRMVADGRFPQPLRNGPRNSRWEVGQLRRRRAA